MPVRQKTKTQYVEHNEEYVGEEMKPFVALLATQENQMEKGTNTNASSSITNNAQGNRANKRKVRFWRKIAAFFS